MYVAYPHRATHAKLASSTYSCGPDTVHVTYREGGGRTPIELASLLEEFQRTYDLPTATVVADRGLSGFANSAVDKAAGLRLDWTRPNESGQNPGVFCLQAKGAWFEAADGETAADFLQLLEAYGPYRITRIDYQQTVLTKQRLTPWWVREFQAGRMRVVGKKCYEPRGKRDHAGGYPEGATLYHGARTSERFARQYDKHLQCLSGPPRRRDEIEVKGESAADLWRQMQQQLLTCEQLGTSRGATLHAFSKSSIRALLPIRDTSRWSGKHLPQNWAQMAEEPRTWANLFDGDPITVKGRERKVTSLLRSYRYSCENFGAAVSAMTAVRVAANRRDGQTLLQASRDAYANCLDDMILAANEERVRDFLHELPISERDVALKEWLKMLQASASNQEQIRDAE